MNLVKLGFDSPYLKDPYTRAVNEFMGFLEANFPKMSEAEALQLTLQEYGEELYCYESKNLSPKLAAVLVAARTSEVPFRDVALLDAFYQSICRLRDQISPRTLLVQEITELVYNETKTISRAKFIELVKHRNEVFSSPSESAFEKFKLLASELSLGLPKASLKLEELSFVS